MEIKVLYEDDNIIVVEKPPKIPSQKDPSGDEDLMTLLNREYLGLVHRLDRPVGGVMVFGKNKISTAFLSRGITSGAFHKQYLAVVCGKPIDNIGVITDFLIKDGNKNVSKVVEKNTTNAKEAILNYKLLSAVNTDEFGILSLLLITLITGRHHQIRVQLANKNLPLWGDTKYNLVFANNKEWTQISLWSHTLKFRHPLGKKVIYTSYPYDEYPWNLFEI